MKKENIARDRLSIDIAPQEHRKIKAYAALHGQSIREYVIESIREHLRQEDEEKQQDNLVKRLKLRLKQEENFLRKKE